MQGDDVDEMISAEGAAHLKLAVECDERGSYRSQDAQEEWEDIKEGHKQSGDC